MLTLDNLVMILTGKSAGKPNFGCPFCSASSPYLLDGELYCLRDLLELHQVKIGTRNSRPYWPLILYPGDT